LPLDPISTGLMSPPSPSCRPWLLILGIGFLSAAPLRSPASDAIELLPDLIVREAELHDYDVVTDGVRVLLRLSTATANIGSGPLHLIGVLPPLPDGNQAVIQRVFRSDGSHFDREAGQFEHHPTHDHVHLEDWAIYRLREHLEGGGVGDIVAEGDKTSFCILDSFAHDPSLPGAPASRQYFRCETDRQGLSVGWADIYHRRLFGQNIDIAGLPHGTYWLEVEVDPDHHILESDESNNITRVVVEIGEPVFLDEPLEIAPHADHPHSHGRVDLRVGTRRNPRTHLGDGVYAPARQVLTLSPRGKRRTRFHASVENEGDHVHDARVSVSRFRAATLRWRHFETGSGGRRNVTASLAGPGYTFPLDPAKLGTFRSIATRVRPGLPPGRGARWNRSGLVFRAALGESRDRARIVVDLR